MQEERTKLLYERYIKDGDDFITFTDDVLCEEIKIKDMSDELIKQDLLGLEEYNNHINYDWTRMWYKILTIELTKRRRLKLLKIKDKINENANGIIN